MAQISPVTSIPEPGETSESGETPMFTILYFAAASSHTRRTSERLPAPSSVAALYAHLEAAYPGIRARVLDHAALTVNLDYVETGTKAAGERTIRAGDEVAVIPPVSSG